MGTTNPIKRVSVISTGNVQIHPQHVRSEGTPQMWWLLTSRRWTKSLPINVCVIEHEDGLILFDTGQDRAAVTDPAYYPGGFTGFIYRRFARFNIDPADTLAARLATLGYDVSDVRTAVFSHLHPDHAGGVSQLRHADLVVSDQEWEALIARDANMNGLMRNHVDLPGLRWRLITSQPTTDDSLAPFTDAHDLLGDGTLTLLPTPRPHPRVAIAAGAPARRGPATHGWRRHVRHTSPGTGASTRRRQSAPDEGNNRQDLELRRTHPDLVILPTHDPDAANRLAAAAQLRI